MIQRIQKMFTAMPIKNAVFDTKNVKNKQENTYSIRIIEEENEALRNRIAQLEKGEVYSTEEVKTNKIWIDGKPIYRKTIDFGMGPNATDKIVATGLENVTVVNVEARGIEYEGYQRSYNRSDMVYTAFNGQKIYFEAGTANYSTNHIYVTLEYTKTTD